jgi:hypothetical protein
LCLHGSLKICHRPQIPPEYSDDIYFTYYVPSLNDNTSQLVKNFKRDIAANDPSWNPLEFYPLELYMIASWVVKVLERMVGPVTREAFLEEVYATPLTMIGDMLLGPYSDNCAPDAYIPCCNQGAREVFLLEFPNLQVQRVPGVTLTWSGCDALESDLLSKLPFKFGQSVPLSGPLGNLGVSIRAGILGAFNQINANGGMGGRNLELISYDDRGAQILNEAFVDELATEDNVLAFLGFCQLPAVETAVGINKSLLFVGSALSSMDLRIPFNQYIVNIRASVNDEMAGALNYFITKLGLRSIGLFYESGTQGEEVSAALGRALLLEGLTPTVVLTEKSDLTQLATHPPQVLLVYNPFGQERW